MNMQGSDKGSGGIVEIVTAPGRMFRGGCAPQFPMTTFEVDVPDLVSHPPHYTTGTIECLDYILDKDLTFLEGQVVKYITRARLKENELQDKKKARFYLDRDIALLEAASGSSE